MLQAVQPVLKKFLVFFVMTQPKLKIEPIPGTGRGYGQAYRLTEPSGEHRDVYVFRHWEIDEKTGKRTSITDLNTKATGYTNVLAVDYEHRTMHGNPAVIHGKASRKKLSFEDHEALVAYFEELDRNHKDADFDTRIVRLYPKTQTELKVKPIPGTEDGYGGVYRLTEPSGEHRDVYVFFHWEVDEKTGKRTAVTDFTSRSTGYTNVIAVDYEHRGMRGRPTVIRGKASRKKLSFEDHEALVTHFEELNKNRKGADFDCRIDRLYPSTPKDKIRSSKNAPEPKL